MSTATKLSPLIKSLISAPHAKPGPLPSPPAHALSSLFERIRTKGETGGIGKETWLTLKTASLLTVNSPDALCRLYDYASRDSSVADSVQVAATMRETGLKCISFNGIPRTINGLGALRSHLPPDVVAGLSTKAERLPTPTNIEEIKTRGRGLWDDIYSPHHDKLRNKLADSHPDLPIHILNSHYGPLLADPFEVAPAGGSKIGRVLTSLVAITCLRAQTGVGPQVTSHVFGLLKAAGLPDGLQGKEWLCSEAGVRWVLESVDEISEVVGTSFAAGIKRESKL